MDGGYALGGYSDSNISGDKSENSNGAIDYWIVKTDSLGNILWQNTIGGNGDEYLESIAQTVDGGYILGGYSRSNSFGDKSENCIGNYDYWIVKTDSLGNVLWENTIGGTNQDNLYSIIQTSDEGYLLGGWSLSNISGDKTENSNGAIDYWLVKTDSIGNIEWQNTIGGGNNDYLVSIILTNDEGYLLGGYSESNISGDKTENCIGNYDYWIVKIDSVGIIQWQNTIGGNGEEQLQSILQTSDNGFLLGGSSDSNVSGDKTENAFGLFDYWIVKTDSVGDVEWQNTIGGNQLDFLNSIFQSNTSGYILGGFSESGISGDKTENSIGGRDSWVVKIDTLGLVQWENTIGGTQNDGCYSIASSSDGFVLGGFSSSNISGDIVENSNGLRDFWIVKIAENPTSLTELLNEKEVLYLYPNPASSSLTIETRTLMASGSKLTVTDVADRTLLSKTIDGNVTKHQIDISSFSSGIYFVQIDGGKGIERGRFVKE